MLGDAPDRAPRAAEGSIRRARSAGLHRHDLEEDHQNRLRVERQPHFACQRAWSRTAQL